MADGKGGDSLTSDNICIKLSNYALSTTEGHVKFLTCRCTGGASKTPYCDTNCGCRKAGRACVPTVCGCKGNCVQNREERDARRAEDQAQQNARCE